MTKPKFKTGLIIGKFYPFHRGHQFLIETALKQVEKLTVIVCQTHRYHIPVETRVAWIRELYPNIEIIVFRHSARLDSTSTDISKEWGEITVKLLGQAPDVVFSSENYGTAYAEAMGSKHILVDEPRLRYPISGTKVRANPVGEWNYLPEPTKEYFARRIVVLGAESTGTTTLAIALAKHYQTAWVPEYGRLYYEGRMYLPNSSTWTAAEFTHIAMMQDQIENTLARISSGLLICDTDSWVTRVWHHRYRGSWNRELEKLTSYPAKALYILTAPDIPFVQDGTRDGEQIRLQMHETFIKELEKAKKPYIIVTGSRRNRLKQAVSIIDTL